MIWSKARERGRKEGGSHQRVNGEAEKQVWKAVAVTACVTNKFKSISFLYDNPHVPLAVSRYLSTDGNTEGYMVTCEPLAWVTLEIGWMWWKARREASGCQEKIRRSMYVITVLKVSKIIKRCRKKWTLLQTLEALTWHGRIRGTWWKVFCPAMSREGLLWTERQDVGCSKVFPVLSCRFLPHKILMLFLGNWGVGLEGKVGKPWWGNFLEM